MTHLDLFSGIGGFAIAAQACGYTTIGFCEREPYAQQILKERFGAVLADAAGQQDNRERGDRKCGRNAVGRNQQAARRRNGQADNNCAGRCHPILHPDIFTLNGADYAGVDLLTGGFPCQPFSVAGKRRGAEDDRAIWPEMLRVIGEAKPTWIIGENVAGIVTMELDNILSDLEALGYAAWPLVIPACAVDARHRRDRVWIVAHAGHLCGRGRAEPAGGERAQIADDGQAVADAKRTRPQGQRIAGSTETGGGSAERADEFATRRGDEDVAYADSQRGCVRQVYGEDASDAWESSRPRQRQDSRQLESAVCGMADGIPEGLDSGGGFCQWPEEDHETPRVTTGMKHRAHRLKGLGNAIVVQVATEIIRAISLTMTTATEGTGG